MLEKIGQLTRIALALTCLTLPANGQANSSGTAFSVRVTADGWSAPGGLKSKLERGEVVVNSREVEGSSFPRVRAVGVVSAPPERVWAVVEDCAQYVRNLPRYQSSRRVSTQGSRVRCESVIDFPAPLSDARIVTDAVHRELEGERYERRWRFVEGDFDENQGSWTLMPFDEAGTQTLVIYSAHAEPHAYVPPKLIAFAQNHSLPRMFQSLRDAV